MPRAAPGRCPGAGPLGRDVAFPGEQAEVSPRSGPVVLASVGDTLASVTASGALLLAVPVALLAGLVSFFSPCMLPLVPGYLSYVTGLSAAEVSSLRPLANPDGPAAPVATVPIVRRGRLLAGSVLFVLGFTVVFVSTGALFGGLGAALLTNALVIQRVLGVFVIVMGLGFLGLVPWLEREARFHRVPRGGLAGAAPLGALFGLGWTPCIGPTLAAVLSLSAAEASAGRGALLSAVYSLGLGLPFVVAALGLHRALGAFDFARRNARHVKRAGGALLVLTGGLLVSGLWNDLTIQLRVWASGVTLPI